MLTDFLLDADSEPCEGLPCDDLNERAMRMGSLALLRAVERAQGKWVAPLPSPRPRYVPIASRRIVIPGELIGERVIRMTADAYGFTVPELTGRSRKRRPVCARIVAARLLRDLRWQDGSARFSLPQIGKMLGNRDHSTICYSLEMFGPYRRQNPEMKAIYNLLRRRLR